MPLSGPAYRQYALPQGLSQGFERCCSSRYHRSRVNFWSGVGQFVQELIGKCGLGTGLHEGTPDGLKACWTIYKWELRCRGR